jgi:hypothetical protein
MSRKFLVSVAAAVCAAPLLAAAWGAVPASASTGWRVQQVPQPAGTFARLRGVSCPAAGVCIAVGDATNLTTNHQSVLAERWAGGRWVIQATASPSDNAGGLSGVSCLSVTDCTAFGGDGANPLVEHWDGTAWTIVPSPKPAGTDFSGFSGGACVSATNCTAVGLSDVTQHNRGHEVPFAAHWDGTSWTITHVPVPAGSIAGDLAGGVWCVSATYCVAVGSIETSSHLSQSLAERWNGTRWSVQAMPNPAGADNLFMSGVSCTSRVHCTAVGGYIKGSTETPLAERWDGTAWTIQADTALSNSDLVGVSCTSSTSCTAVGQNVIGVAEHWDGTTWTAQTVPVPHHKPFGDTLLGVSCASATTCTTVGYTSKGPLAEHE